MKILLENNLPTDECKTALFCETIYTIGVILDAAQSLKSIKEEDNLIVKEIASIIFGYFSNGSNLNSDVVDKIFNASSHFAFFLKDDFAEYLSMILERLEHYASISVSIEMGDEDNPNLNQNNPDFTTTNFSFPGNLYPT